MRESIVIFSCASYGVFEIHDRENKYSYPIVVYCFVFTRFVVLLTAFNTDFSQNKLVVFYAYSFVFIISFDLLLSYRSVYFFGRKILVHNARYSETYRPERL